MSLLLERPSDSPRAASSPKPFLALSPDRPMNFPQDSSEDSDSNSDSADAGVLRRNESVAETSPAAHDDRDEPLLRESDDRFSLFPIQ